NIFRADQVTREMRQESQELDETDELQFYFVQEFLTEKNYVLTGDQKYITEYDQLKGKTQSYLDNAEHLASATDKIELDNLAALTANYNDNFDQIVSEYKKGDTKGAIQQSIQVSEDKLNRVQEQVDDMSFNVETRLEDQVDTVDTEIRRSIFSGVLGLIVF